MKNKKLIIMLLFIMSSVAFAEINNYQSNNFTAWKVIKADAKEQYVEVVSVDKLKPDLLRPLCIDGKKMIFKYEMMGADDSFYDKKSQAINVKSLNTFIYKSVIFALKIDVEEDNDLDGKLNAQYDNICVQNKAQRYISPFRIKSGIDSHGVIKYIGDITVKPPF